jgi:crotonobetainyl-CoA:carnitine CoA-transferase CaiB-like acyl-CoA transferase
VSETLEPGSLDGLRVLELASDRAAFAGKMLADLGAEVIVVEPPGGHESRWFAPFAADVPDRESSLWWWHYNTGKLGVVLDLGDSCDRARFCELVASSDVVLESEPPRSLSDLGLDYEQIVPTASPLVWVSVTPFGRTSRAGEPATDLTVLAGAGPAWSCGYDDHSRPPVRPGGNQGFHSAALWAVMGALAALRARRFVGGQRVDVSMHAAANVTTEAATYEWLVAGETVQRQTLRHAAVRPTAARIARSADGHYVIGGMPRTGPEFRALVEWIGELGVADDVEDYVFVEMGCERGGVVIPDVETDPVTAAIFHAGINALRRLTELLPAQQFFREAQRRGLPVGIVLAPEDVMEDEHFIARGFPVEVRHDDLGRSYTYPGAPFVASASPWRVRGRAPHVGEHTEVVLGSLRTADGGSGH